MTTSSTLRSYHCTGYTAKPPFDLQAGATTRDDLYLDLVDLLNSDTPKLILQFRHQMDVTGKLNLNVGHLNSFCNAITSRLLPRL